MVLKSERDDAGPSLGGPGGARRIRRCVQLLGGVGVALSVMGAKPAPQGAEGTKAPDALRSAADDVKLRQLEAEVNALKEKVFRSKARLLLLRETVLNGSITGAKARIVHRNEMGNAFTLERISYSLDGEPVFNRDADAGGLDASEIELFNGSIVPGNHNLSVMMVFRGSGGLFSYMKGYVFRIKSSYAFTTEEGKLTTVKVVGYEKGGLTTDLKDRPAIRYDVEVRQDSPFAAEEALGDRAAP